MLNTDVFRYLVPASLLPLRPTFVMSEILYKQHLLRAISLSSFSFELEPLDSYWRTRATTGMSRELLEFTGDGYLIRCVLRMLYWRWPSRPAPFLTVRDVFSVSRSYIYLAWYRKWHISLSQTYASVQSWSAPAL
jgi:hypothetical protein